MRFYVQVVSKSCWSSRYIALRRRRVSSSFRTRYHHPLQPSRSSRCRKTSKPLRVALQAREQNRPDRARPTSLLTLLFKGSLTLRCRVRRQFKRLTNSQQAATIQALGLFVCKSNPTPNVLRYPYLIDSNSAPVPPYRCKQEGG